MLPHVGVIVAALTAQVANETLRSAVNARCGVLAELFVTFFIREPTFFTCGANLQLSKTRR